MRNYVIINEINSNTIQGLAINILPPITKPMMRSQIEEIDGRDGDLVTELGYSAYDKTMEIGLWGTYDIDAIIKYFTGEGTIVFSTEPDKYYYFKILNQIDYEKLLKFKKATITFHCQPYKYPTSETPLEEAYEYVEATGTDITLDNTEETIFNKFDLIGNTYQEKTNGNQLVDINAFNDAHTTHTFQNDVLTITATGGNYNSVGQSILDLVKNNPGKTIKIGYESIDISGYTSTNNVICQISITNNGTNSWNTIAQKSGSSVTLSGWTIPNDTSGITTARLGIYVNNANVDNDTSQIKLTKPLLYFNNNDTYEPYTGGKPAPSPDYPEDVHVVSGDNEISITGKNLANNVYTYDSTAQYAQVLYFDANLKPNTTYTISFEGTAGNKLYFNENIFTTTAYGTEILAGRTSVTLTTKSSLNKQDTTQYGNGRWVIGKNSQVQSSANVFNNVQMELGNQASNYEEYKSAAYPINLGTENLIRFPYNSNSGTYAGVNVTVNDDGTILVNGTGSGSSTGYFNILNSENPITLKAGTYTISIGNIGVEFTLVNNATQTNIAYFSSAETSNYKTFTLTETTQVRAYLPIRNNRTYNNILVKPMLEKGSKANSYTAYGKTPIEMASIPNTDYKDAFVHEDNKWYKYAMVGKAVFNGSENWSFSSNGNAWYISGWATPNNAKLPPSNDDISNSLSNNFTNVARNNIGNVSQGFGIAISGALNMKHPDYSTGITGTPQETQAWKNWLSNNNTEVYYVLSNPTQTEINDETLKAQLDDLWENAISYKGQTNITQTNNDLPFIMDVSALELGSDHLIINNTGTAYSKPTIDIEGTGIVDIYLNDEQIFEIDMTNQNEIIIDTEKMEAYTPDNLLANRLVTGDYSNFKLAPGENDLRFSGDLTKATVTRYIRWI